MTPFAAYMASLPRALVAAALAVIIAGVVRGLLDAQRSRAARAWTWGLLLVPLCTPALLVGYFYATIALLLRHEWLNASLYTLLVTARIVPVATAMLCFAPRSAVSPAALWCAALARRGGRGPGLPAMIGLVLRGPGLPAVAAFAVGFVLAFGEFEIASLMQVRAWTVWLFDAQVGGLALGDSLRFALPALVLQLLILGPVLVLLLRRHLATGVPGLAVSPRPAARIGSAGTHWIAAAYILVSVTGGGVLPAIAVVPHATPGLVALWRDPFPVREIPASLMVAAAAAALAFVAAGRLVAARRATLRPGVAIAMLLLCVPGLLGSLPLALGVRALVEPWMARILGEGPAPLLAALLLLLLPPALILRGLSTPDGPAMFLARAVHRAPALADRGRHLLWLMKRRADLAVFFLLGCWAYFDLCCGVLLAPRGMALAPQLLYNQMHYGRRAVLSAMVLVFVAAPVVVFVFALIGARAYHRRTV